MSLGRSITAAMVALLFLGCGDSQAHGRGGYWRGSGRPGFTLYFGFPLYIRPYFYPPYYYPPPVYQAPLSPPVYIVPGGNPANEPQNWFYCPSADSYYPHVAVCPEGWRTVRPYPDGGTPGYWFYCDDPAGYYPYVRQCYRPWRQVEPAD